MYSCIQMYIGIVFFFKPFYFIYFPKEIGCLLFISIIFLQVESQVFKSLRRKLNFSGIFYPPSPSLLPLILSLSAVGLDPFPIFPCNRTYLVILYCILFLFCLLNIIFVCIYLYIFSTFSHYLDLSNVLFPLFSLTYLSPPPFLSPPPLIKMHVFCPNLFYLYVQYM